MERHRFYVVDPAGDVVAFVEHARQAAEVTARLGEGASVHHFIAPGQPIYIEDGLPKEPLLHAFLIWRGYERRQEARAARLAADLIERSRRGPGPR